MKNKKIFLSSIVFAILFSACSESNDSTWTPFIYPDKNNMKRSMQLAPLKTLQECKQTSILKIDSLNLQKVATSKCGLNCNYHSGMKQLICEEMN